MCVSLQLISDTVLQCVTILCYGCFVIHYIGQVFIVFFSFFQTSTSGFRCTHPGCRSTFSSRSGFQMHMKRHSGVYLYNCPYCNKGFSATKNIKEHFRMSHTGLFGFHCMRCRQEFQNMQQLKTHLELNNCVDETGERLH